METFDYGNFLINYNPDTGTYRIASLDYGHLVGFANIEEGPGAVMLFHVEGPNSQPFLDACDAMILGHFLSDLNSTISE